MIFLWKLSEILEAFFYTGLLLHYLSIKLTITPKVLKILAEYVHTLSPLPSITCGKMEGNK